MRRMCSLRISSKCCLKGLQCATRKETLINAESIILKNTKTVERQRGIILSSIGMDSKVFTLGIEKTSRLKAMSSFRGR